MPDGQPAWLGVRATPSINPDELRRHLGLRLPGIEIGFANIPPQAAKELHAYLLLNEDPTGFSMTLVLSDGRAYDRHIDSAPGGSERVIANDAASLLRAASEGTKADREGVDVAALDRADTGTANPTADETKPDPASSEPAATNEDDAPPPSPAAVTWLLGLRGSGAASFGLSSDPLDTSLAFGGSLELDLAARSRFVLSLGFTPAVHRGELTWARFGIALGAGYLLRRENFELLTLGYFVIEPSVITDTPAFEREGAASEGPPPMWGPRLSLGPGARLGQRKSLRLGARIDLSYLVAADRGVGAPRIFRVHEDGTRELVARAGGAELGLGVDLQWWFSLRPSTRTRPADPQ